MENRRHFTRVVFKQPASLITGNNSYDCHLLDLSLKGALVSVPAGFEAKSGDKLKLTFRLADSDIDINMETQISHVESDHVGLKCLTLDIDSATHLKRLIELNVGNDELLHRELAQLIEDHNK